MGGGGERDRNILDEKHPKQAPKKQMAFKLQEKADNNEERDDDNREYQLLWIIITFL